MTELRIVSEPRGDAGDATFVREGLTLFNALTGVPVSCSWCTLVAAASRDVRRGCPKFLG